MTSSLVGSEMCIRDRLQPHDQLAGTLFKRPADAAPTIQHWMAVEDPDGPVSYTHLTLPTICSV
eukprot:7631766-Prorocentrum_lima.AAC.1